MPGSLSVAKTQVVASHPRKADPANRNHRFRAGHIIVVKISAAIALYKNP
jgi:hypothetical protein